MISAQEAVKAACDGFNDLFKDMNVSDILLEEIDQSSDGQKWLVTLSAYWHPQTGSAGMTPGQRLSKIVKIDAETGAVTGMKNNSI